METFSRGTLDPRYVTGFCDGLGTFTYSRSGRQIALYFGIKLTSADEPILHDLQSFFGGIGRIYDVGTRGSGAGTSSSGKYFRVTHREELTAVVDHFDRYPLQTRKRDAYEVWRHMVELKQRFRDPDRDTLDQLAAQLSSLSTRGQPAR